MKLKSIKVANAVNAGGSNNHFLSSDKFDLTLTQGVVVTIKAKKDGSLKCTSLFNVIEWEPLDEDKAADAATKKKGEKA